MLKRIIIISLLIFTCYVKNAESWNTDNITVMTAVATMIEVEVIPIITHTPLSEINILGDKLFIRAGVDDYDAITNMILYYHKPGDTNYQPVDFNLSKSIPEAEIPPHYVTLNGIEYYIKVETTKGTDVYFKSASNPVKLKVSQTKTTTIGAAGGTIKLIDGNHYDGAVELNVPEGALGGNVEIKAIQIYPLVQQEHKDCTAVYDIHPHNLTFLKYCDLTLLYFDLNNDGKVDGTDTDEKKLKICWWDGFDWRYLGGKVDPEKNTVTVKVYNLNTFGIISSDKIKFDYRPKEKIITPNGDLINDNLFFEGLSDKNFEIKIFNSKGSLKRTITDIPYWDGKDNHGRYLPIGLYFYQIKVDNKVISGVFAIAR